MKDYKKYSTRPLRQRPNRVWRSYSGGRLIDRWRGESHSADGDTPEEWIASTVVARGDGRPDTEGLSVMELDNGESAYLRDLIAGDPVAFLGEDIAARYCDTGLLVKMLDSLERLTIQVHPDKQFARRYFNSDFGKTEGWYVLGGRQVEGEDSYVLLGFREGVTRESWADKFRRQDIGGMIGSLHKIRVEPGDVFIVNGGVPHAIGSGCFLLEIQEPTDYTMRVEKTTPAGKELSGMLIHQGLGEERMLDTFHYDPLSLEETLRRWKAEPVVVTDTSNATLRKVLDQRHTDCFALSALTVRTRFATDPDNRFHSVIVYSGEGTVSTAGYTMNIKQGDELFIPAGVGNLEWTASRQLELLLCYPPK